MKTFQDLLIDHNKIPKNFKDLVEISNLADLLKDKNFFNDLFENHLLNKEDLRDLLNRIDKLSELWRLCKNTSLINYILNDFVLNKGTVDRFNRIIEKIAWYKDHNIHTVFEYIRIHNKDNEEILKLNGLNEKVCLLNSFDLTKDQKLELIEILKNNDIALNRFKEIVDNNLEHTFDFDALKVYLNKPEKKNILNI